MKLFIVTSVNDPINSVKYHLFKKFDIIDKLERPSSYESCGSFNCYHYGYRRFMRDTSILEFHYDQEGYLLKCDLYMKKYRKYKEEIRFEDDDFWKGHFPNLKEMIEHNGNFHK